MPKPCRRGRMWYVAGPECPSFLIPLVPPFLGFFFNVSCLVSSPGFPVSLLFLSVSCVRLRAPSDKPATRVFCFGFWLAMLLIFANGVRVRVEATDRRTEILVRERINAK